MWLFVLVALYCAVIIVGGSVLEKLSCFLPVPRLQRENGIPFYAGEGD